MPHASAHHMSHTTRGLLASAGITMLLACTAATRPSPTARAPGTPSQTTGAAVEATPAAATEAADQTCNLVCQGAQVVSHSLGATEYTEAAVANANAVFASMHDDLLACYKSRLAVDRDAHAFLTVDVVIEEDGSVGSVTTTGGAPLGDRGLACMTARIKRARFDPPHGGGTLHFHVPFAFQRLAPETI